MDGRVAEKAFVSSERARGNLQDILTLSDLYEKGKNTSATTGTSKIWLNQIRKKKYVYVASNGLDTFRLTSHTYHIHYCNPSNLVLLSF